MDNNLNARVGDAIRIVKNPNAAEGDGWLTPVGRRGKILSISRGKLYTVELEETKKCSAHVIGMWDDEVEVIRQMELLL